jgi:CRP-like cAMP-binding protein
MRNFSQGQYFGELALLTGQPRLATIVANDSLEVLAIDRDVLKSLRETLPTLEDEIIRNLRRFDHMDSFTTMSIA